MSGTAVRPNLFIVGAAKAGTTALANYLGRHPQIFISPVKEPAYFARDLGVRTAYSASLDRYLALFAGGAGLRYRGEASTVYLLDPGAARSIRDFCPQARVVIVLRNPIEAMQAVFGEARKFALEPRREFPAALAASDRGRPRVVARHGGFWTQYRHVVRYAEQVERYLTVFGSEQVHVAVYDDLAEDPAGVYRRLLEFLGVDPWEPQTFKRLNPHRGAVRSYLLQRLVIGRGVAPGTEGRGPAHFAQLRRSLAMWNLIERARKPLDASLHAEIAADLRPDVERLSALVGRDLTGWLNGSAALGQ